MSFSVVFETLGCRLNQIESEAAMSFFSEQGFLVFPNSSREIKKENVILALLNTCAVTQKSEQKARYKIRYLLNLYPNACILVTGCYAELSHTSIKKINERILVIPGKQKSLISIIPKILKKYFFYTELSSNENEKNRNTFLTMLFSDLSLIKKFISEVENITCKNNVDVAVNPFVLSTSTFFAHSRASIKIQDGCNSACTYCAIRLARGKSISLPVEEVIKRVKNLEENGHNEVVFTAVNLSHYKSFYNGKEYDFTNLLNELLLCTAHISFRISSIYPELVTKDFCDVIKSDRVRPHFHLSVQSGSNRILKLMGRHYSREDVIECVSRLRNAKKNPFIACDIIAAFPSELDEDFEKTLELCSVCNFSYIHAFPFSARQGTLAYKMENQVPNDISKNRVKKLCNLAIEGKLSYVRSCIGNEYKAIAEKDLNSVSFKSLTENFLHCDVVNNSFDKENNSEKKLQNKNPLIIKNNFSSILLPGKEVRVRITDVATNEIISNKELDAFAELVV